MTKSKRVNREHIVKSNTKRSKMGKKKAVRHEKSDKTQQHKKDINTQPSTQVSLMKPTKAMQNKQIDQINMFFHNSNKLILKKYGADIMRSHIEMENARLMCFSNYNEKTAPQSYNYKKLLYCFDKAIQHFRFPDETYFLTSYIIDAYLNTTSSSMKDSREFKLIASTSFYIASKMCCVNPFTVNDIRGYIGSNLFTQDEIIEKELDILNQIDFDLNIISIYDMIQIMFSDGVRNSEDSINALEVKNCLNEILDYSVSLAKLIECNKSFINIKISLKAIGCIVVAYDIFGSKCKELSTKGGEFIRDWIRFLIETHGYTNEILASIYNRIESDYEGKTN